MFDYIIYHIQCAHSEFEITSGGCPRGAPFPQIGTALTWGGQSVLKSPVVDAPFEISESARHLISGVGAFFFQEKKMLFCKK